MEIKKTKKYDMFHFRDDNRVTISPRNIEKLKERILKKNLLHLNPLVVNSKMEIINGQHRLLAAKALGYEIYYIIDNELTAEDTLHMNSAKSWKSEDYLNYFVLNAYPEYIKFNDFLKIHNVTITQAFKILKFNHGKAWVKFTEGEFIFPENIDNEVIDICKKSCEIIKIATECGTAINSGRYWDALVTVITNKNFDKDQWFRNLKKIGNRLHPRNTIKENVDMLASAHNFKCTKAKITFVSEEFEKED